MAYKDTVSVAAMLRGLKVLNHELSPKAQAQLDRLMAERIASAEERDKSEPSQKRKSGHASRFRSLSSRKIHQKITKRIFTPDESEMSEREDGIPAPVLKPKFRAPRSKKRLPQ